MATLDFPTDDGPLKTAVVVLNWNGKEDTLECLGSLEAQQNASFAPIVVDNGSQDDSVRAIRKAFPTVRIIETHENLGYAEGNNVGIRYALEAGAEHVLVLNNDTVLEPDCMSEMIAEVIAHPEAGAVGPKTFIWDTARTLYSFGGELGWKGPRMVGFRRPDDEFSDTPRTTAWLNGCAILFTRAALERVGLFDARYFLLFEETDWCVRARRAGFTLRVAPKALLWHKVSSSFVSRWSPRYVYYYTRNHFLWVENSATLAEKPSWYYGALRRAYRALRRTREARPEMRAALRRAVFLGLLDYCRRRFGRREFAIGG